MADETGRYQPLVRPLSYNIYPADGFTTSVISTPNDASIQLTYWIVDGSPDAENTELPYADPQHYLTSTKHALQTAVQLRPNVALQMAQGILEALSKLPEHLRTKYELSSDLLSSGVPRQGKTR